jgi:hypothetical protein
VVVRRVRRLRRKLGSKFATLQIMLKIEDIPNESILFYDIETSDQYAPYCDLKMIGAQLGFGTERFLVETASERKWFRDALANPDILKVTHNGTSFDNIVLHRHGFPVNEVGVHDTYLMLKAIAPWLASWALKFSAWHFFGDCHFPEMELKEWMKITGQSMWDAPKYLLKPYCLHDVWQTEQLFLMAWEIVQKREHWNAYMLDISQGEPVREMELVGGLYLDEKTIRTEIATLQMDKLGWESRAAELSGGRVQNPNSRDQMVEYLTSEGFELGLTDNGEFAFDKDELLDIIDLDDPANDKNPVARCTYEVRQIQSTLKYYKNYLTALGDNPDSLRRSWIPKQFSISNARSRRYTSNSKYGLNFQNPNKAAKKVQVVPDGWLGVWFDSTQVENVVHIYESEDRARRLSYEADPDWNEYVWLCNRILGGDRTKKELDSIPSPQFPGWSIYKQFKTIKLALNFGMGIDHFCHDSGVDKKTGREAFGLIHQACPAIKELQDRVATDLNTFGRVQDVFGHIYTGQIRKAYKVVAYLIQGCGTASLPKAQIRANWETLRALGTTDVAHMSGTTHDENEFRLSLRLPTEQIFATLQTINHNMTDKFSAKFDGIPLRAKMYLSKTSAYAAEEFSINDREGVCSFIESR